MKPYGTLVTHRFTKTTVVGDHVFFKGKTDIGEKLLARHKQNEAERERKLREAQGREGMTASELLETDETAETAEPILRTDGPTPEGWVRAGYDIAHYPPPGYMAKPYEDEAAFPALLEKIAAQKLAAQGE